jgi:hypothetical protein
MSNLSHCNTPNIPNKIKQQKLTPSEIIESQLSRGAILHQDLEVGVNIKKGINLIKELSGQGFELSQSEKNIIFQYCRSGKPVEIFVPSCLDYLPEEGISSFSDPIIGGEIPKSLFTLIDTAKLFTQKLKSNNINYICKIILSSNPRKAQQELLKIPEQRYLIFQAMLSTHEKIVTYLKELNSSEIIVSNFKEEFDFKNYTTIENNFLSHLNLLCKQDVSFEIQVNSKRKADDVKTTTSYQSAKRVGYNKSYDEYTTDSVISNFAEYLTIGQSLDREVDQPIIISHIKKIYINQRNMPNMQLPGSTIREHRTIPVITKPKI